MQVDDQFPSILEMKGMRRWIRPCVQGPDGRLYRYLDDLSIDISADPFNWRPADSEAIDVEAFKQYETYHKIDSPEGFFTPTIAEVLRQLPYSIREEKAPLVFTTVPIDKVMLEGKPYFRAETTLFKEVCFEDELCAQMGTVFLSDVSCEAESS
jgi:uncharacterized protein YerC